MLSKLRLIALATAGALLAAACAGASWSSRQTTAQALTAVLAGDQRTAEERARDVYRHPKETLLFFGLRPEMSVLEVWPEPGYYSAIIAPLETGALAAMTRSSWSARSCWRISASAMARSTLTEGLPTPLSICAR